MHRTPPRSTIASFSVLLGKQAFPQGTRTITHNHVGPMFGIIEPPLLSQKPPPAKSRSPLDLIVDCNKRAATAGRHRAQMRKNQDRQCRVGAVGLGGPAILVTPPGYCTFP